METELDASPLSDVLYRRSPTAISLQASVVMTLQEWLVQKGISQMNGGRRRRVHVPDGQIRLPF